jgi:hypothetical protein
MLKAIGQFILAFVRLLLFGLSKILKRLGLAVFSLFVGFIGPLLALNQISDLFSSNQHVWDAFAELANKDNKFGDIILACMPGGFLCFTDLMAHVFDDDFEYAKARLAYLSLVFLELIALIFACILIAGYAKLQTPLATGATQSWYAQFEIAWLMAKGVIVATVAFEIVLACIESYREAQDANWQI